jgi:hypothetical protein
MRAESTSACGAPERPPYTPPHPMDSCFAAPAPPATRGGKEQQAHAAPDAASAQPQPHSTSAQPHSAATGHTLHTGTPAGQESPSNGGLAAAEAPAADEAASPAGPNGGAVQTMGTVEDDGSVLFRF